MRKAIYFRYVLLIFMTALLCGVISALFFAIKEEKQVEFFATQMCKTISYQYTPSSDAEHLSELLGDERVTIIAPDGVVLDDSVADPTTMENHLDRPEVANANEGVVVSETRKSETLGKPYLYAAMKMPDNNILRVAYRYSGIVGGILYELPVILISTLIGAFFAIFFASAFIKKMIRPLERFTKNLTLGRYDDLTNDASYYEIEKITVKIKDLLRELTVSGEKLRTERDKIHLILSNMGEGLILLDEDKKIRLINNTAKEIFGCKTDVQRQNIMTLTRNPKIEAAVTNAIEDSLSTIFDLQVQNTVYSVHISSLSGEFVGSDNNGVTILLVDVGAERKSQVQRSEFFSNASHELKTPITSVLGFSDMLVNGLLDEEKQQQVYERMFTEAKRMNHLIDDILTISRLESGVITENIEPVNLTEIVQEVANALTPQAKNLGVSLTVTGDDVIMEVDRRQIYELFNNVTENAIKYNKEGGTVDISISHTEESVVFQVVDTGIGIPEEAQGRIFERFYRVDTGRSKSVGGTGLGLAIVKHIVLNLDGEIVLKSNALEGTTITITLPLLKQSAS